MTFHEIVTEADPASWHLDGFVDSNGAPVDMHRFTSSTPMEVMAPLRCRVSIAGRETDFTWASGAPVASRSLSQQLLTLAPDDVQLVPLLVEGSANTFDVVNVLPRVDALDGERSIGTRWPEGSPAAGRWLYIVRAALRADLVKGHMLFRIPDWTLPIFCTDAIREALEPAEWTGMLFRPTL